MDIKRLFNIFVTVFIDLEGFGLILPFYPDQSGATPFLVGLSAWRDKPVSPAP